MRLSGTLILYNAASELHPTGRIKLVRFPEYPGEHFGYSGSTGACYPHVVAMSPREKTRWLFNLVVHLVMRDRIHPQIVHEALCEIKEYRDGLSADMPVPAHLKRKFQIELENDTL